MPAIHSLVEISQYDVDESGNYIGDVSLVDTRLSIRILPGLGTVRFREIRTSGSLLICRGTKLEVDGTLQAYGGVSGFGDVWAVGDIEGGLGILIDGELYAYGAISCGGDIWATENITANSIHALGYIKSGGTINCGGAVSAKRGKLTAGKNMIVNGPVTAKTYIEVNGDIRCYSSVTAETFIHAGGLLHADQKIQAANGITADRIICEDSVYTGSYVEAVDSITCARDIQAGYHIKSRLLHAKRIFAGLKDGAPWHREVHGEIQHGEIAYGDHVQA